METEHDYPIKNIISLFESLRRMSVARCGAY